VLYDCGLLEVFFFIKYFEEISLSLLLVVLMGKGEEVMRMSIWKKMIPSPFQLLKSKTGDVSLLYKFFYINLNLVYKNLK